MNVISKIVTEAETAWHDVVAEIEGDYAKVKAALPASAQANLATVVSDLKQGASDAVNLANGAFQAFAPELTQGVVAVLEAALASATNGATVPLNPLLSKGVGDIVALVTTTANAWALKIMADAAPPQAGNQASS